MEQVKTGGVVQQLKKVDAVWARTEIFLTTILFVAMLIMIVTEVVLRFVFLTSLQWSEEFVRYSFIAVSFVCLGAVLAVNAHIEVDVITSMIFEKIKNVQRREIIECVFTSIKYGLLVVIAGFTAYLVFSHMSKVYAMGQLSAMLKVPVGVIYTLILYGFVSLILHSVLKIIINIETLNMSRKVGA